jgi:hypothetical protein
MGTDAEKQLASFMAKFTPEISSLAEEILAEMRKLYPAALELVYDNYNALAIGFGPSERASEAIFSIALYPRWVSLFFLQAKGLHDPDKLLRGSGNVVRYIVLPSPAMLHAPPVRELMREALSLAKAPLNAKGRHRLIVKSVSAKQRPRRPATEIEMPKAATKPKKKKKSEVGARKA